MYREDKEAFVEDEFSAARGIFQPRLSERLLGPKNSGYSKQTSDR